MINFYDLVPSIYKDASRDFQYLSWLINIVLNSVKHNVDDLYDLPNNKADSKLYELLATTLGFKIRRNYDSKQLLALVSIIPSLLKYKGTKKAITLAGRALLYASGADGIFECDIVDNVLEVTFPKELVDITLFIDLLPYILPAGITCHITRKTKNKDSRVTKLNYADTLFADIVEDLSWNNSEQTDSGLAGLYRNANPEFYNFKANEVAEDGSHVLNNGLLENSVIPVLNTQLVSQQSTTTGDEEKDAE